MNEPFDTEKIRVGKSIFLFAILMAVICGLPVYYFTCHAPSPEAKYGIPFFFSMAGGVSTLILGIYITRVFEHRRFLEQGRARKTSR